MQLPTATNEIHCIERDDTRPAILDNPRDKFRLILEPDESNNATVFFDLDLPALYADLEVVIFSTGQQKPSARWLESHSKIILAFDSAVYKIDPAVRRIEYFKKLNGVFFEFLKIHDTGACVVLHQLGINSILSDGGDKWSVHTGLVENFVISAENIVLTIMDEPQININLETGAASLLSR